MGMRIGQTNMNNGFTRKEKWFKLEANTSNLYRVLPPLHSLAEKGQFAKYYKTHKIFHRNDDGSYKVYSFNCIEKINRDTKMIEHRCPFCDKYSENSKKYELAKDKNIDKQQLKEFFLKSVLAYKAEQKFYINAVSRENTASVLPLTITAFRALQNRIKNVVETYSIDATGINGIFLDFRKTQKYEGDRDTEYTVDVAQEVVMVDGKKQIQLKEHVLTADFIKYLEGSSTDLGTLFRSITDEDIAALVSVSPENKVALLDRIFSRGEKQAETNPLETKIANTDTYAVTRLEVTNGNIDFVTPSVAPAAEQPTPVAKSEPVAVSDDLPPFDLDPPAAKPAPVPAPKPAASSVHAMSDDEFLSTFLQD